MKKRIGVLVPLLWVVTLSHCLALTTDEAVEKVQTKYAKVTTLTADFTQESTSKMLGQTQKTEARGRVYFQRPGRMRWEYETRPKNVWVSDGTTLWFYQPEENQVLLEEVDPEEGRLFMAFLVGESDLRKDFEIHHWGEEAEETRGGYRIELTPRQPHAMMDKLVLIIDKRTHHVRGAEVYDVYGNVTHTRLKRIRINSELEEDLFRFEIPEGTEVIKGYSSYGE
jgi:outer membrane lipoprotein carrier protein